MSKLIYVDKLKKDILDLPNCYNGFSDTYDKACIIGVIDEQPTVEERKTGKWRYSRNILSISYSDMMITCDQCGYTKERSHGDVLNFCPNCGARMEGGE